MLILASASPQRRAILERLSIPFELRPTGVEELERGDPAEVARENALRKARAARERSPDGAAAAPELILGVDTLVTLDGHIFGKPRDLAEARATLTALAGRTHEVLSGLALVEGEREQVAVARTAVTFRELDPAAIEAHLALGEWRERSGGYAIQGASAKLVRRIEGDYENIVGLPVALLFDLRPELF